MPEPAFTPTPRAQFALWVSLWGVFVTNVTLTVLLVALPSIAKELSAPLARTNWVSLAPILSVAAATPLAGGAADRWGAKRVWLTGFTLSLLGITGSALAPDLSSLILSRFVTGVGSALFMPAALAIICALYPPSARTTPIGYWTSTVAISPLLGVVVGGYLTELFSWRTLFWAQLAMGVPALLAGISLPSQPSRAGVAFDWQGALAAALAAGALVYAFSSAGAGALALGVAVLASVWLWQAEQRAVAPVFPAQLFVEPSVRSALLARFAMSFTYMGTFMILPYLLGSLWGKPPSSVALTIALRPLAMGMVGGLAGRLSRRFGNAGITIFGAWMILIATLAFAGLDAQANAFNRGLLAFGLVIAGVGLGVGSPGAVAAVTARVDVSLLGTVSGLMTLIATLANALGMAGMFALLELSGGVTQASAYRWSNLGGAAMAAIGVHAAYAMRRNERAEAIRAESAS